MAKRAYPEKNVIYTFRWRKGDIETYSVLEFIEELPSGRLLFWNVNYKNYTDMKPERFSYIHRWNLKSERAKVVQQVIPIKEEPVKPNNVDKKTLWQQVLNVLKVLPEDKRQGFREICNFPFETYIKWLDYVLSMGVYNNNEVFDIYNEDLAPYLGLKRVI